MSVRPETKAPVSGACATITFLPEKRTVNVELGTTLLHAAQLAGVAIDAPCGERGKCGKCRVRVLDGKVSKPSVEEQALLKPAELGDGIRLSCEARALGSMVVDVPESSRNLTHRKAAAELTREIAPAPFSRKICVRVAIPSIAGCDLRDDFTRLCEALPEIAGADMAALRGLHEALVDGGHSVTAVLAGDQLIAVEAGDTSKAHYGVALDIGTTTVVGYLLDLRTGNEVAAHSYPNPQTAYGADVISRIEFARGNAQQLEMLRNAVTNAVNTILEAVAADAHIDSEQIYEMTVVGNTCMTHLFLGIDPLPLGHAPYTPVYTAPQTVPAEELGVALHPRGRVRVLPNIAGFVGADTVGVLATSALETRCGVHVAVDIGTNCEVLAGIDGRVIACSTAAGPAFEGAKISQGMRAQPGAIDGVVIGEDLFIHTIDDRAALGVCGSGVIDAIGELLRVEMIDVGGRFAEPADLPRLPAALRERLTGDGVVLVWAKESGTGHDIVLTQHDVREIQLVKAAIFAGIATMLAKIGYAPEQLDSLFIAGAFGTYITKEHAVGIGLIPNIPLEKLVFLGNAAGTGAKMALISYPEYTAICAAAQRVGYVELAGDELFADNFMMAMMLAPGCEG